MKSRFHTRYALLFFVPLLLSLLCDILLSPAAAGDFWARWWHTLLTRFLCATACLPLILKSGFLWVLPGACVAKSETPPRLLRVVGLAAAFLVALNNFPWIALVSGRAQITAAPEALALFALGCLGIGVFEELLFRGFLLPLLLDRLPQTRGGRLWAVLLSSAVFGLVHLLNLFGGNDPMATLLQVGYSFLVGAAAAVLLLLTGNIVAPVLFHTLYDIGGRLISACGTGGIWDTPTVILTAAVAVFATAALTAVYLKIPHTAVLHGRSAQE